MEGLSMTFLPANSSSHACGSKIQSHGSSHLWTSFEVYLAKSMYNIFPGRPSQSMHFGDLSETNGWEAPTKLAWTT